VHEENSLELISETPNAPLPTDRFDENVSWKVIKPYSFTSRSPNMKLPNGKTAKENEVFNDIRCEKLNKQWDGGSYNLWTNGNSQHGQDRVVRDYFNGAKHGRYIEVGSYDGETFSNT